MTGCGRGQKAQVTGDQGQTGPLAAIMPFSSVSSLFLSHPSFHLHPIFSPFLDFFSLLH